MTSATSKLYNYFNSIGKACSLLAIVIGISGLCGWLFDISLLRTFFSHGASMKINTALLIFSGGLGLLLDGGRFAVIARLFLLFMITLSAAILIEQLFNINLGIDELIRRDTFTNPQLEAPGRTSLLTAFNSLMLGTGMLLLSLGKPRAGQLLAFSVFLMVYASLTGHLFNISGFYQLGKYSGLAFHTALALLLLSICVFLYSADKGWITILYQYTKKIRFQFYFLIYFFGGAPLFTAMYLFIIHQAGLSAASNIIILIIFTTLLILPLAYYLLRMLTQLDSEASLASEQLEMAMQASGLGIWSMDLRNSDLLHSEKFAELLTGKEQPLKKASDLWKFIHPEDRQMAEDAFKHAGTSGKLDLQLRVIDINGFTRWMQFYGESRAGKDGNRATLLGTAMDISSRKELEKQKDEFISIASHELKTPLTSLKSHVQVAHMLALKKQDEVQAGILEKAETQVNKMVRMITGFLNVARSERGLVTLKKILFPVDELINEVIDDVKAGMYDLHIEFSPCEKAMIFADREKIEQVLVNLIGNAVKYSPQRTPIIIHCTTQQGKVIVSIADQGLGIKEIDKAFLFDRFFRGSNPQTKEVAGFGIGLYLSAEIIRLHKGRIWLDSEINKGSTFYFSLPLSNPVRTSPGTGI